MLRHDCHRCGTHMRMRTLALSCTCGQLHGLPEVWSCPQCFPELTGGNSAGHCVPVTVQRCGACERLP
jgi:hypothetical protein